jgi:putative ABC transport system ATP-binding protein
MTAREAVALSHAAPAGAAPILDLAGVGKVFLTDEMETHALSDVHLQVRAGEWLSIVGPSGSGKTTLLAILGLLDTPSAGSYRLGGHATAALGPRERAALRNEQIGFVFQSFNLIGDLTVAENVELPLTYRGMGPSERRARVAGALEQVGMGHRTRHLPSQLSGGQQQRVAVARAVAGDPAILLADEPTGNLDSATSQEIMAFLKRLNTEGHTILVVTHEPDVAAQCPRQINIRDGRIVESLTRLGPWPGPAE